MRIILTIPIVAGVVQKQTIQCVLGGESVQREDLSVRLVLALVHVHHESRLCLQLVQYSVHVQQQIQARLTCISRDVKIWKDAKIALLKTVKKCRSTNSEGLLPRDKAGSSYYEF